MPENSYSGWLPNGATTVFIMIGHPVAQVKSPLNFNRYFAKSRIDAVMVALDVSPKQVGAFFELVRNIPNFGGCCVTVPHKQAAYGCMDDVTTRARDLKAVNVVRVEGDLLMGDMVDGLGFMLALHAHKLDISGKRVALFGVGGAGTAIAHSLACAGAAEIRIQEPDVKRHHVVGQLLKSINPDIEISFEVSCLEDLHLVVNASPVGMAGDPNLPFPLDSLQPECLVADVVTDPAVTPLLAAAREKGCEIQLGAEMAHAQLGLMGRHMGLDIPDPSDILTE